ncbi:MAG: twin-arginine translocase TatA/TatE family subunit [Planctomycetes bacterium]|nr:twin-arginine translocase TatA/TatE family subunit [Planctomycetota bacterium]
MFGIGTMELVIVAGIALLLFGSRLPQVMRGMGQGIGEFKKGLKEIESDVNKDS